GFWFRATPVPSTSTTRPAADDSSNTVRNDIPRKSGTLADSNAAVKKSRRSKLPFVGLPNVLSCGTSGKGLEVPPCKPDSPAEAVKSARTGGAVTEDTDVCDEADSTSHTFGGPSTPAIDKSLSFDGAAVRSSPSGISLGTSSIRSALIATSRKT